MANAYSSRQFSNALAYQFYKNYISTSTTSGSLYQCDKIYFGFFQNNQAVSDKNAWNAWAISPSGTIPSANDTYYPVYFNTDSALWRNKMLYLVPATRREMVKKSSTGSIEYNGQKWEIIGTYNEESTTTGSEHRYIYYECDLKYYDSTLTVSSQISDKTLITGIGLYKTSLITTGSLDGTANSISFNSNWQSAITYDAISLYKYRVNDVINTGAANTQYTYTQLTAANLVYLYQNTFPALVRSDTLNTKFSLILEL